ncbi:MAG TPA: hypothetical protein PLA90_15260 [Candidatus Sumerlaeota bacterium]|nr:hypothetical protein [Candidatus Sumerlaeota bacterium]
MKKCQNLLLLLSILHYLCAVCIVVIVCFEGFILFQRVDKIYLLIIPAGCFLASFFAAAGWLIATRHAWFLCVILAFLELFCFCQSIYIISALGIISLSILLLPPVREIFEENAALRRSTHPPQAVASSGTKNSPKNNTLQINERNNS